MLQSETGWSVSLAVPAGASAVFESVLESFGGALVVDGPDRASGAVPLTLYLETEPDRAELATRLAAAAAEAGVGAPDVVVAPLPDVDWVAESQKALPPIRAGRFYLHGSHVTAPPPAGAIAIRIEAGQAFGTGRHETTAGCLVALTELAKRRRYRRPLDLGCGSGVLAIAMAKLWPVPVLAVDSDAASVRVAGENARTNGVGARVRAIPGDGYRGRGVAGPYDLVVANILAGPLAAMATELSNTLAPGGTAVLSGLLTTQAGWVLARHRAAGLSLRGRIVLGEWTTLILGRPRFVRCRFRAKSRAPESPTRRLLFGGRRAVRDNGRCN